MSDALTIISHHSHKDPQSGQIVHVIVSRTPDGRLIMDIEFCIITNTAIVTAYPAWANRIVNTLTKTIVTALKKAVIESENTPPPVAVIRRRVKVIRSR